MAKTTLAIVLNCIAFLLILVSVCAGGWVHAETQSGSTEINYGLYRGDIFLMQVVLGSFRRLLPVPIRVECVSSVKACAASCKTTALARELEVKYLAEGTIPASIKCDDNTMESYEKFEDEPVIPYSWYIIVNVCVYIQMFTALMSIFFGILHLTDDLKKYFLPLHAAFMSSLVSMFFGAMVLIWWGHLYNSRLKYHMAFAYVAKKRQFFDITLGNCYWYILLAAILSLISALLLMMDIKYGPVERNQAESSGDQNAL